MLYSHLHVVEYDTSKEHGTTHRHLTLAISIDLSAGTHTLHEQPI